MSYASATGAQRLEVNSAAEYLAKATYPARHGTNLPGTAGWEDAEAAAARAADALRDIGVDALLATEVIVADTDILNVENSAGNLDSSGTATVAAGVLTSVRLAATKTIVSNAQALTGVAPTGTYTNTVTFTVAAGVITAIVLS